MDSNQEEIKERIITLPLKKNQFKNMYISPGKIRKIHSPIRSVSQTEEVENLPDPEESNIQKIRKKIFTHELEDLVKRVSQKKTALIKSVEPISLIQEDLIEDYTLLENVFEGEYFLDNLNNYVTKKLKDFGIHEYGFLIKNEFTGLYSPEFFEGLDEKTGRNLYFHSREVLHLLNSQNYFIIDKALIESKPFLEKIFTESIQNENSKFIFLNLKYLELDLGLILFLSQDMDGSEPISGLLSQIQSILKPSIPAIYQYFHINNSSGQPIGNLMEEVISYAKKMILNRTSNSVSITKYKIMNYNDFEDSQERKMDLLKRISEVLTEEAVVIESLFDQFLIVDSEDPGEDIIHVLNNENDFTFLSTTKNYPQDGKNFYLYF
ncbi:MAG: hypothetical protein H7A24_05610 [Leptospiraceae bacterium]|nr:hypothetical protein [Leptospiraceae bacterium]MCP5511335.1 hypothetical protein [Leptospiraceae bacterium]